VQINHSKGPHPLDVTVAANVTGGVPPYAYAWSFGDGASASVAGATHSYAARGVFVVTLRVTDQANGTATAAATVRVDPVFETMKLLNASHQPLGPGEMQAWIAPFTIPATAATAWMNGTVVVTSCSLGGNCGAFVEVLDASDEANLTHGAAITNPIWCLVVMGACQANQSIRMDVDLSDRAGQTEYLVVFNTDLVWSQTVTAHVSLSSWY
jgi:PKD repeat protein